MKRIASMAALSALILVSANGCVSQKTFDDYKDQVEYRLEILACESRVDAYEDTVNSDEPDGTRRDEPLPTRRDEPSGTRRDLASCDAEFNRVVGGDEGGPGDKYQKCQPKMEECITDGANGFPLCNECYDDCFATADGTWPDAKCPL